MSQIVVAILPGMSASSISSTLEGLLHAHRPICAVASAVHRRRVVDVLAERDVVDPQDRESSLGGCFGLGVLSRPHADGWLLVPGDAGRLPPHLLLQIEAKLQQHPIVHAMTHGRRSYPVGLSADLYGEMVRVENEERFRRLMARYPAHAHAVEDLDHGDFTLSIHGSLP